MNSVVSKYQQFCRNHLQFPNFYTEYDLQVVWDKTEQQTILEYLHSGKGETVQALALGGHLGKAIM